MHVILHVCSVYCTQIHHRLTWCPTWGSMMRDVNICFQMNILLSLSVIYYHAAASLCSLSQGWASPHHATHTVRALPGWAVSNETMECILQLSGSANSMSVKSDQEYLYFDSSNGVVCLVQVWVSVVHMWVYHAGVLLLTCPTWILEPELVSLPPHTSPILQPLMFTTFTFLHFFRWLLLPWCFHVYSNVLFSFCLTNLSHVVTE